jgi:hypothetical protein
LAVTRGGRVRRSRTESIPSVEMVPYRPVGRPFRRTVWSRYRPAEGTELPSKCGSYALTLRWWQIRGLLSRYRSLFGSRSGSGSPRVGFSPLAGQDGPDTILTRLAGQDGACRARRRSYLPASSRTRARVVKWTLYVERRPETFFCAALRSRTRASQVHRLELRHRLVVQLVASLRTSGPASHSRDT